MLNGIDCLSPLGYWTGRDIKIVVAGVRTGDITCLNRMSLCQVGEQGYSKENYYEALEIIPFTRSLYFCTGQMPVVMGMAEWQELTERVVVGLELLVLAVEYKQSGIYKSRYCNIDEGCEEKVGMLVTRAKIAVISCLIMSKFDLFIDGVWEGLRVNPGVCRVMKFVWPIYKENKDEIHRLADKIGWTIKTEDDDAITLEI